MHATYMFAQSSSVQIEQMEIAWPTVGAMPKQYISWLADITSNHRLIRDFQKLFVTPRLEVSYQHIRYKKTDTNCKNWLFNFNNSW